MNDNDTASNHDNEPDEKPHGNTKEEQAFRAHERRMAGKALRHLKPEHVGSVLSTYAAHLKATMTPDQTTAMSDDDVDNHADAFFKAHAAAQPEQARAQRAALPTVGKPRSQGRW